MAGIRTAVSSSTAPAMAQRPFPVVSIRPPSRATPLTPQLLDYISAFSQLTNELFALLSSPTPAHASAPPNRLLDSLADLDIQLDGLLAIAVQHTRQQQRIESLLEECANGDRIWREAAESLRAASELLARICIRGDKIREGGQLTKSASIDADTILAYAKLIAPYTSAPLAARERAPLPTVCGGVAIASAEMNDPAVRAMLPFPTEDTIRMGRMGALMVSDEPHDGGGIIDVGETRTADATRPVEPHQAMAQPLASRRPPEAMDEDVFDLDLNPDL